MQQNGWDHALQVTAGGKGLVGHAGAVLLRKAADQTELTSALSGALKKAGTSPRLDRGITLVSMAAAIALGATSISDIALLAHLTPLLGAAPSGPTARRALDLAGTPRMLDRIARARARARAHAWPLIAATATGFPWLVIAGKVLEGWEVIDMDATLVTAHSPALAICSCAETPREPSPARTDRGGTTLCEARSVTARVAYGRYGVDPSAPGTGGRDDERRATGCASHQTAPEAQYPRRGCRGRSHRRARQHRDDSAAAQRHPELPGRRG
jgi:hypothetical protein